MSEDTISARVRFEKGTDGTSIYGCLQPGEEDIEYSEEWLDKQLALQGYSGLGVMSSVHEKIEMILGKNVEDRILLGKAVDAKVAVTLAGDSLSVSLAITSAKGGEAITTKEISGVLNAKKVHFPLINKRVIVALIRKSQTISPGESVEHVIAHGKAPIHGKDSQFKCLVEDAVDRKPNEREDGSLDYYDLGELICVEAECEVMRKYPPTPAVNGLSVTGQVLPAREGKVLDFSKCEGAEVSPLDSNILLASIKGQPIIFDTGVNVVSLYTVKNVDLRTGHVDYDGSVVIKGDVVSGMKVKVTGDIQVFGMVENASIEAGGNIDIKLGAIGRAETTKTTKGDEHLTITCNGNLSASHLENAVVNVKGDVLIKSRISNCEMVAGHQIIVGNSREKKSGIVGGHVSAGTLVRTEVLGSEGGTHTFVAIECSSDLTERMSAVKEAISEHDVLLGSKLGLMVGLSKKKTEESKQELQVVKQETEVLKAEINELINTRDELDLLIAKVKEGKIIVQKEAHAGVIVAVFDQETVVNARYGKGVFHLNEQQAISFGAPE